MEARRVIVLAALAVAAACGDDPTGPATGALEVAADVSGEDIDPDGFTVTVGGRSRLLALGGSVIFTDLSPGTHTAELSDLSPNCSTSRPTASARVAGGDTAAVRFTVVCSRRVGAVQVAVSTSGEDADADGYRVAVNGDTASVEPNGTVVVDDLDVGEVAVELLGVSGNCAVDGANPATVSVTFADTAAASFSVSCELGLLAFTSDRSGDRDIYVLDPRAGTVSAVTTRSSDDLYPTWSPDGDRIAFTSDRSGNHDIHAIAPDGSGLTNLTAHSADDALPAWGPDDRILFTTRRDGNREVYAMRPDGTGLERLTNNDAFDGYAVASPDGQAIAFISNRDDGVYQLFVMNAEGRDVRQLTDGVGDKFFPSWSPDSRRIVFTSYATGGGDLYLIDADGGSATRLTSNGADDATPSWSPGGTRIAFASARDGDYEIYLIDPDGSNLEQLTRNSGFDAFPAWQR